MEKSTAAVNPRSTRGGWFLVTRLDDDRGRFLRSAVGAEEAVVTAVIITLHASWPRQAGLGPRRFASIDDLAVHIVGPGATVGTVGTRVPQIGRASCRERVYVLV